MSKDGGGYGSEGDMKTTSLSFKVSQLEVQLKGYRQQIEIMEQSHKQHVDRLKAKLYQLQEVLTPSADTKGAYSGEFYVKRHTESSEDSEGYTEKFMIPWTTIKDIMKMMRERAGLE
jgi:hypothetical protein